MTGTNITPEQCGTTACFHVIFIFDAHSGPSGEHPTGTVRQDVQSPTFPTFTFDTAEVTCLDVSGNRATIGAQSQSGGFGLVFFVEDNDGAGQDRSALDVGGPVPSVCPAFPSTGLSPIFGGDITVHDAGEPVVLTLAGRTVQPLGTAVNMKASCDEECTALATGRLKIKRGAGSAAAAAGTGALRLKRARAEIGAGETATLKLKTKRQGRRRARRALGRGEKVVAKLKVAATDAGGNSSTARRKVKLRR